MLMSFTEIEVGRLEKAGMEISVQKASPRGPTNDYREAKLLYGEQGTGYSRIGC
jgi:hypothetical protein